MDENSEKNRPAAEVVTRFCAFDAALGRSKRKYPTQEFRSFVESARRYIELTSQDPLIRRDVAATIHGLRELLELDVRVPGEILYEAGRLECLFFDGFDPDGDELPGL
jgi:hypothetical protein